MLLVPGIGRHINGSTRWINLGLINFQISELAKIGMVLYMAGFCCRKNDEVRDKLFGFFKPILLLVLVAMICLMQPDFGAMVVIVLSSSVILLCLLVTSCRVGNGSPNFLSQEFDSDNNSFNRITCFSF